MRTIEQMVEQEIHVNCSQLVSDMCKLCESYPHYECSFVEQHQEILWQEDYEGAARDYLNSTINDSREDIINYLLNHDVHYSGELKALIHRYIGFENFCHDFGIEPYVTDALQHWIVSPWLAEQLERRGGLVSDDVHGLCIWGRTTCGQAIEDDSIIKEIYEHSVAEYKALTA